MEVSYVPRLFYAIIVKNFVFFTKFYDEANTNHGIKLMTHPVSPPEAGRHPSLQACREGPGEGKKSFWIALSLRYKFIELFFSDN